MHSWFSASSLLTNAEKTTTMSFYTWRGGGGTLVKPKDKCDNIDFAYKREKILGIYNILVKI
jgi:hypothetical protein